MENQSNNISITMNLTLEEMYSGVTKRIKYKRKKPCTNCEKRGGCKTCSGKGITLIDSLEEIEIPKGVNTGMTLQFKRKGHYAATEKSRWSFFSKNKINTNNEIGNLIVKIKAHKHEIFSRENTDLIYHCQLKASEISNGPKLIAIEHLNMEVLNIEIPKNTSNGKILRIAGMGFKDIKTNQTGSLMIRLEVV